MKKSGLLKLGFLIIFSVAGFTSVFARSTGSFDTNITFNGNPRLLAVYVPSNYDSTVKYRLMICLHGLGDNVDNYRNALVSLGWPTNFPNTIFVCPEAYNTSQDFYTPAGDEAVIQAAIDYAKSNYAIDDSDIILQGFSIGGRAALRYGLDYYAGFKGLLLNTPAVQGIKEALNGHPIAFSFNYANASKIPIYITHGLTDVAYEGPIDTMFRELVLNNGKAWYFEFPGMGHNIPPISKIKNCISFFNSPATPGYNLDIQSVIVPARACNASVPAQILIRNIGSQPISSVTFQYSINNGALQTYTWTPQLATLTSFDHRLISLLPNLNAAPGKNTLNVKIKFLNNSITDSDSVYSSNSKSVSFQYVSSGTALPLLEGFNGPTIPPANWLAEPQGEFWTPWFIDSTTHESGSAAMGAFNTIISVFDNAGRREGILTPVMDLTTTSNPGLKFDVAYNYDHYTAAFVGVDTILADTLEVLISTDCGDSWQSLFKKGGKQLATFHDPFQNPTTIQAEIIVPEDTNWRTEEISLAPYASAKEAVIKFDYISDRGGSIYIYNLALSTYLGIKETNNLSAFQIYPNPASDKVNIETGNANILKVNVIDLSGKAVMNISGEMGADGTLSVNTSTLPKGLYLFQVITDKGVNTSKVLLN